MSDRLSEALRRVPGWSRAEKRIESMPGGLSNQSYRVTVANEPYVVRLANAKNAGTETDRVREIEIHQTAAEAGIAPEVLFADAELLVTRFVEAPPTSPAAFNDSRFLDTLADLLRRVHALPVCGERYDARRAAGHYEASIRGDSALQSMAGRCLTIIERAVIELKLDPATSDGFCCCHNDIVAANLLRGDRLWLIDWEYAADNDPFFDLAGPLAYHELGREAQLGLLSAYLGTAAPESRERLAIMMQLFDALNWLWLAWRRSMTQAPETTSELERLTKRLSSD